jgi:hypothetical protein
MHGDEAPPLVCTRRDNCTNKCFSNKKFEYTRTRDTSASRRRRRCLACHGRGNTTDGRNQDVCRAGCDVRGSAVSAAHVTGRPDSGTGKKKWPRWNTGHVKDVSVSRRLWCPLPVHVSRSLTCLVSCAILCGRGAPLHHPDRVQERGEQPCRGPAGAGVRQSCGRV